MVTAVSEEHATSIFRMEDVSVGTFTHVCTYIYTNLLLYGDQTKAGTTYTSFSF